MKTVSNYILLVDAYRRPSRRRNTAGRYRVGAKTEKEAVELLREKIKFGSIQVYYRCRDDEDTKKKVGYKKVVRETGYGIETEIKSAIAPRERIEV